MVKKNMKMCKFIETLVEELLLTYDDNANDFFKKYIADNSRGGYLHKREEVVHALVTIVEKSGSTVE